VQGPNEDGVVLAGTVIAWTGEVGCGVRCILAYRDTGVCRCGAAFKRLFTAATGVLA